MSSVYDALHRHRADEEEMAKGGGANADRAVARVDRAISDLANLVNICDAVLLDLTGPLADQLRHALDACIGDQA